MRRVSSNAVKQITGDQETTPEVTPVENGVLSQFGSDVTENPLDELPSADAENEAVGNPSFETNAEQNIAGFNEFNSAPAETDLNESTNEQDDLNESEHKEILSTRPPASEAYFGFIPQDQLSIWIGGALLLLFGGLALLSKLTKKKTPDNYRAPVGEVDPQKEVRGRFKPAQRFQKPETGNGESTAAVSQSTAVSKMAGDTVGLDKSGQVEVEGEEFDFSADLADSEIELFESDELVEAEPEKALKVSNQVGSLSARPPESHQKGDLSFVEPTGSQTDHFAQSSSSQFASSDLEFCALPGSGDSDGEFPLSDGEELFDDSEQDMESVLREDDLVIDSAAESDKELEQEIQASESASDFSAESNDDHPIHANSEDEEAVMNLRDDDSEQEFDFDLGEAQEFNDSGADFDFDLEVDEPQGDSAPNAAMDTATEPVNQLAADTDEPIEVISDEVSFESVAEAQPETNVEVSSPDDSAEFAELFDDSSEDLAESLEENGLELNAPANSVDDIKAVVNDSFADVVEDSSTGAASIAAGISSEVEGFSGIDLDDSVEQVAEAVASPGLGGVAEAVGDVVGGVGETAGNAVEGVADTVGGVSDAAKATAVAAGAAASGGIMAKLFGWGKKKDVEQAAEGVVENAVEEVAGLAPEFTDDVVIAGADDASAAALDVEDVTEFGVSDDEAPIDLSDGADDDEFDFELDDEGPKASESPELLTGDEFDFELDDEGPKASESPELLTGGQVAEGQVASAVDDDEFDFELDDEGPKASESPEPSTDGQVADDQLVKAEKTVEVDSSSELVSESNEDEFDFESDEFDMSQDETELSEFSLDDEPSETVEKAGFSSMDTLREPGPAAVPGPVAAEEPEFSSADTIREPVQQQTTEEAPVAKGLGVAAVGGAMAAAGALAAGIGLDTSLAGNEADSENNPDSKLEEVASNKDLANLNAAEGLASDSKTAELESKIESLEKSNQSLEESTKALEEKFEAKLVESEKAIELAEQEHAAKLEEHVTGQAEQAAELEKLKAELAETKESAEQAVADATGKQDAEIEKVQAEQAAELEKLKAELAESKESAEQAVADAAEKQNAELEKVRAELESTQSNAQSKENALSSQLESVQQQLADAVTKQADENDGMPTGSLMAAAGAGAAGLFGGSLMGESAKADDSPPVQDSLDEDLKKRFEGRLKAERRARKDAQSQLEQAEQQRNDIAKALREFKKEVSGKAVAVETPVDSKAPAQLKALESQLERQAGKLKALEGEKSKLLSQTDDLKAQLEAQKSKLNGQAEQTEELAKLKSASLDSETKKKSS